MQISVAHACERPAEFLCKMHKATPATWVAYLARFVVTDVRSVVAFTAVPSAPSIQNGTEHWDGVR
jgi:hypothetical protein